MKDRRSILVGILSALLLASATHAQDNVPLEFEVASVRQNTLEDRIVKIEVGPGGRFAARGYSLKLLIQRGFGVKGFEISGGPPWLDVDRFDIVARAPAVVTSDLKEDQLRPMLRALLIHRFALRFHKMSREMPGFALTLNGRSKLKHSAMTEEQDERTVRRRGAALVFEGVTLKTLAKILGGYFSRPVADETGLQGLYDFELSWSSRADQVPSEPSDPDSVSLITAVRDQLGLKLAGTRIAVETIVIDSAEKPSQN